MPPVVGTCIILNTTTLPSLSTSIIEMHMLVLSVTTGVVTSPRSKILKALDTHTSLSHTLNK